MENVAIVYHMFNQNMEKKYGGGGDVIYSLANEGLLVTKKAGREWRGH